MFLRRRHPLNPSHAHSKKRLRRGKRRLFLEILEPRRVLNVEWRNPVDSLDVDNDGSLSPLDVLSAINYINSHADRSLPPTHTVNEPYYDVDADQSVSPLDVLAVINQINSRGSGLRVLKEDPNHLVQESSVVVTLGQTAGSRVLRMKIDPKFDSTANGAILEDLVAVYLVDPSNPSATLLDRGTQGTALFTLSGKKAEYATGRVQWDGSILQIDLSDLPQLDTGILQLQLLNNDSDSQSSVTFQPLSNQVHLDRTSGLIFAGRDRVVSPGPAMSLQGLSQVNDITVQASNVRFSESSNRYEAEVRIATDQTSTGRNVAITFPGLPSGIVLSNASGTTATGEPYVNIKPAIANGGLGKNSWSDPVLLRFDNPNQIPFSLKPKVLADVNHAPTLSAIAPIVVHPGGVFQTTLNATDPDGDSIAYDMRSNGQLPNSSLSPRGELEFRPTTEQIGHYEFDVIASDGALQTKRSVVLDVVADTNTTTRVSGKILKVDGKPLANIRVEIGSVQGLTNNEGAFELNLGSGTVVSDTMKVRGDLYNAGGVSYPFIAEKTALLLERDVIPHVNNMLDRPIYLPSIDLVNSIAIDPTRDTRITTGAIEGASVLVKAGSLVDLQGTPYTGKLSITEVPVTLTPAALPENLIPDLVITIQPGDMVFATPAPLSLPNRSGRKPGSSMDLWAINPTNGEFEIVGKMVVSADGKTVDTVTGGVRYSSWSFAADPINRPSPGPESYKPKKGCEDQKKTCAINSEVETYTGTVIESHPLVAYQSQGQSRNLTLVYDSMRADPRPIVHFRYENVEYRESDRLAAGIAISNGRLEHRFASFFSDPPNSIWADTFWSLPASGGTVDAAFQLDMHNTPSGRYTYDLSSGIVRIFRPGGGFGGGLGMAGTTAQETGMIVHVNTIESPFGSGWGIAGLQQLVENPDGTVLLIDGDGTELQFEANLQSPQGDFSTLARDGNGRYTRTLKDQTVYDFDEKLRLHTITDRNGNQTTYTYNATGLLQSITDPVGLKTEFRYLNNRLQSITDPANRVTQFQFDSLGNLTQVTDPDGSTRQWQYDGNHHQVVEINQLGQREETYYDFAGRARGSKRADGTEIKITPAEVRGLYPDMSDPDNSPIAINIGEAVSQYLAPNGNVITSVLDKFGQVVSERDSLGPLPTTIRNANNQITSIRDTRGNTTLFKYDTMGNLLSTEDSLSGNGVIANTIASPGDLHVYNFQGVAGERVLITGFDRRAVTGRGALIKVTSPDGVVILNTSSELSDFNPVLLPTSGTYRMEVYFPFGGDLAAEGRLVGPYRFKLYFLPDVPSIATNEPVKVDVPDFETRVYQFDGVAGQLFHEAFEKDGVSGMLYSPGGLRLRQDINFNPILMPTTGKYIFVVASKDIGDFSGTVTLQVSTQQDAPITGFDELHAGVVAPGEIAEFKFSGPAGLPVAMERVHGNFRTSPIYGLSFGLGVQPLPRSGEYTLQIDNRFSIAPVEYGFRLLNMRSPSRLIKNGDQVPVSIEPLGNTYFAVQGTKDEQIIFNNSGLDILVTSMDLSVGLRYDPLSGLRFPATDIYYVSFENRTDAAITTQITKSTIAVQPLELDTVQTGTVAGNGLPTLFRFRANKSDRLRFNDLGSDPKGAWWILNSDGHAIAAWTSFPFSNGLGADNFGTIPSTGIYYLLLSTRNMGSQAVDATYRFELLKQKVSVTPLTLGQVTTGSIRREDDIDEYTFEATAGQRFFYDGLTDLTDLRVDFKTPSGAFMMLNHGYYGPSAGLDVTNLPILESGTYRVTIYGDWGDPPAKGNYGFKLSEVASFTRLNIGDTVHPQLSPGHAAAPYTFAGKAGQSISITASKSVEAGSSGYALFGTLGQQLGAAFWNNVPLTVMLPSDGLYTLSNIGDLSANDPSFSGTVSVIDISGAPVAPSGVSDLRIGRIEPGEVDTFQFTAPAGLNVVYDNRGLDNPGIEVHLIDPKGNDYALRWAGSNNLDPFTLPASGTYTIKVRGSQPSISGDYEFRFVDLDHDSIEIQLDQVVRGSFDANKVGGNFYRLATQADQHLYLDSLELQTGILFRGVEGWLPVSQPVISYAGIHYIFVAPMDNTGLPFGFRVTNLDAVPKLENGEALDGVMPPGQAMILRAEMQAGQRASFEVFNSQIVGVLDPFYRQISRATQANDFVAATSGTYWFMRDMDSIRNPFPFKLRYTLTNTVIKELDKQGGASNVDRYTYDPTYNKPVMYQDAMGRTTTWELDPATGNVFAVTNIVGEPGGGDDLVTGFTYTTRGLVDTITDARGVITDWDYDPLGRVTLITDAKGTPLQTTRRLEYDAAGNVIGSIDENGHRTVLQYDALNRLTQVTSPDPDGNGPLIAPVSKQKFDLMGNLIEWTDPMGHIEHTIYDTMQRPTEQVDGQGNRTKFQYDAFGNLVLVIDPLGHENSTQFDLRNRIVAQLDAAGNRTAMQYDADNNLIAVTDASGNTTRYEYDARNRLTQRIDPLNSAESFEYNVANDLTQHTDRLGRVIEYSFDAVGRPVSEVWKSPSGAVVNTILTDFDPVGNITHIKDDDSELNLIIDLLGRTTRVDTTGPAGMPSSSLSNTFDAKGNRLTVTDTIGGVLGATTTTAYDALDRAVQLTQTGTNIASKRVDMQYNSLGQTIALSRFSNTAGTQAVANTTYAYDTLNRLSNISHRNSGNATLDSFAYQYDAASRIQQVTDMDGATSYTYDKRDQLIGADHGDSANPDESFSFDATGNRKASNRHGSGYETIAGNRLVSDGTFEYSYDAEGNLEQRLQISSGVVREFEYDHRNRLITVTDKPNANGTASQVVRYEYDVLNRRTALQVDTSPADAVDGIVTYFIYDGANVIADWVDPDGSGPQPASKSMRYLQGPAVDQVFAQEDAAGNVQWHLSDHLGTVHDLVNNQGQVANHLKYDSFGNVVSQSNPNVSTRYLFTGREFDSATLLYYYRSRYYDAMVGRFISEDQWSSTDAHLRNYQYVENNSVNLSDPTGFWSVQVGLAAVWGGQITVGRDKDGFFGEAIVGLGAGGGLSYNPKGTFSGKSWYAGVGAKGSMELLVWEYERGIRQAVEVDTSCGTPQFDTHPVRTKDWGFKKIGLGIGAYGGFVAGGRFGGKPQENPKPAPPKPKPQMSDAEMNQLKQRFLDNRPRVSIDEWNRRNSRNPRYH